MAKRAVNNLKYKIIDRIKLSFVEKDITQYVDYESEIVEPVFKSGKKVILLTPDLEINGRVYSDIGLYDVLFLYNKPNYDPYKMNDRWLGKYSFFYPFNCSCGEPGCAGIWNGIYTKPKKYSIEWRLNKKDGYDFLEKTFYSFNRLRYEEMVKSAIDYLKEKANDNNVIYVLKNDFYSTLKEDLDYWFSNDK